MNNGERTVVVASVSFVGSEAKKNVFFPLTINREINKRALSGREEKCKEANVRSVYDGHKGGQVVKCCHDHLPGIAH